MPGPESATEIVSRSPLHARHDVDAVIGLGVRDRVSHEVSQHLGEPVGVGVQCALDGLQVEVALAEQRQVATQVFEEVGEIDRLGLDKPARLGAREREHVGDEAVHLVEAAEQRDGALVAALLVGLAVEQLDLRAQHRERRAQLVRSVGDEVALAREGPLQPGQHAIERRRQHAHLAAPARRRSGAQRKVARVDGHRDPRHAPQRTGDHTGQQ